ncbi:hypothetical protein OsI_15378 [Oryza sativa Indica Group]|uniref:Uncharacterized protein n=1 Tax=Oryza sativa subsp. indica TaxID=39946 RepID=B8ASA8_ORYSI|nr:hypothetical protein OsI_15378 [Oryza sativa Indica Group]
MVVRVTTGSTWTRRGQWLEEDSGDVIRVDGAGAFRWSSLDKNARLRKRMTRESKADIEGRQGNQYCFGFQDAGKQGHKDKILLGDMIISNKVVVYDMEKQAISWTEHNSMAMIVLRLQFRR